MSVNAITPDYSGATRDQVENFNGNHLIYVCWERHLLFSCPFSLPVPEGTSFRQLRDEIMAEAYGSHPQWQQIDWEQVSWRCNGQPFTPQLDQPLEAQGVGHKCSLRFDTPALQGLKAAAI